MTELKGVEEVIRQLVREEVRAELAKQPQAPSPAGYVSVAEYAKSRSISISTVRNAIRLGRLPAMKIGTAVRIRRDAEIGASVTPKAKAAGPSAGQIADRILAKHGRPKLHVVA